MLAAFFDACPVATRSVVITDLYGRKLHHQVRMGQRNVVAECPEDGALAPGT
jgi:hypothetical protein